VQVFVVRPFGSKGGIDFDRVDRELISPALDRLQMTGRTTGEIARAGNIRADMFQLLLTADIVVADISIHNANVFYELGVRHALRDKRTFLLRASIDEIPFDLKTDRYLSYDPNEPAACLEALVNALAETRRSEVIDSPVYAMLPGLPPPDPSAFVAAPESFREEVERARRNKEKGDLRCLASELTDLPWRREGMRLVGEAQFRLGDLKYAAETWEWVRNELPNDTQSNVRLTAIYQKLGDLFGGQAVPAIAHKTPKVLLFTGHRIDDANRPSPRFPARMAPVAQQAILDAVKQEMPNDGAPVIGIAGGASGGDLLFQEICEELGIDRHLFLIIPRDEYVNASVAPSGPDWVLRFDHQYQTARHREYQQSNELPVWLQSKPDYGIWQRSNVWMLHNALALGDHNTTLIALWDGKGGDGPGGTQHMVETANARGARRIILDTKHLFGL
jgi:hypothetical protein